MHILFLITTLAAAPERLVVGLAGGDLRQTRAQAQLTDLVRHIDGVMVRRLPFALVIDVRRGDVARRVLARRREVRWVESDAPFRVVLRAAPDDPLYPQQWYLHETGLAAPQTAIHADAAWDISRGLDAQTSTPVRVAVVDDGFELGHPDLAANLTAEQLDVSQQPTDSDASAIQWDMHGTRTAGVVAAVGFNGRGITGVCPACAILPVRLLGNGGPTDLYTTGSAAAEAIVWAVDHGAAVINNSWGPVDGNPFNPFHPMTYQPLPQAVADALHYAATEGRGGLGTVVTWSAGNGNELANFDGFASDPRVIAVGAVDGRGVRASYSDYGPAVRLVAPSSGDSGQPDIITTDLLGSFGDPSGDYTDTYGGTSAASAVVAGAAALVVARYPTLTGPQIAEALFDSAYRIDAGRGDYNDGPSRLYGYGRVDAFAALAAAASYGDACTHWLELCGNDQDDDCNGITDDPERCTPCLPQNERCDGRDNNCDGNIDEFFVCEPSGRPPCAPCSDSSNCAVGSRCRSAPEFPGQWCFIECSSGCPYGYACDGEVCVLQVTDDVLSCFDVLSCGLGRGCGTLGVCADSSGSCSNGVWLCNWPDTYQSEETACDGLDNDCDGEVDEHPLCAAKRARLGQPGDAGCGSSGLALPLLVPMRRRRRARNGSSRNYRCLKIVHCDTCGHHESA